MIHVGLAVRTTPQNHHRRQDCVTDSARKIPRLVLRPNSRNRVPIVRPIKIRADATPYNPDFAEYFK